MVPGIVFDEISAPQSYETDSACLCCPHEKGNKGACYILIAIHYFCSVQNNGMLHFSDTKSETESQLGVKKACLNFWLEKLYLDLGRSINGLRLVLPWFKTHAV